MNNKNFRDPVGLLRRLLLSRDPTAYFMILREALGVVLRPADALLAATESRLLTEDPGPSPFPVVLILGGSRTGTTLLYQTLTEYLPVSYFNNLSAAFPRSPITATRKFNRFLPRQRSNFRNYYGSVRGLNSPNDGFHIWNRWFGTDRSNIPQKIPAEILQDMRRFFRNWLATFPRPFINKNNRNSLCISLFETALDKVCYIEISRDPVYVAQSLISSRELVQGDKRIGWGLASRESPLSEDPFSYVDDVCHQVFDVNRQLQMARRNVDSARYLKTTYEAFCADPACVVQAVARQLLKIDLAPQNLAALRPFENMNSQKIGDEEFSRILAKTNELATTFSKNRTAAR